MNEGIPSPSEPEQKPRRVAISIEMDWGYKRHVEVYAGCQSYADEAGWDCCIDPAPDRTMRPGSEHPGYDGVIARVSHQLAKAARQSDVPIVNVWLNSPRCNVAQAGLTRRDGPWKRLSRLHQTPRRCWPNRLNC